MCFLLELLPASDLERSNTEFTLVGTNKAAFHCSIFYSHGTIGKIVFTYLGVLVALDVNSSSTRKEEPLMKSTQKNPFQKLRQLSLAGLTCLACLIWFALVCPPWRWGPTGRLLGRSVRLNDGPRPDALRPQDPGDLPQPHLSALPLVQGLMEQLLN